MRRTVVKMLRALHEKSDFSVQPLCSLCLCGRFFEQFLNHGGTEDTEIAQRRSPKGTFRAKPVQRYLCSAPRVVAALQPRAGISERLRRIHTNFKLIMTQNC